MARLAIFIPDLRGGGAERVALTIARGFIERGHEVDLVLLRAEGELMALLPEKARIIELKVDRMRRAVRPLANYLTQVQPDALLAVMWPLTVVALVARMLARSRARIAVSDHGILSEHYAGQSGTLLALRITAGLLYPRADARIAPSQAIAADVARLAGFGVEDIHVIHNPVGVQTWHSATSEEAESIWGGADARILAVGALKPEKDFGLLIDAVAGLPRERNARLIVVGEGAMRPELKALAERRGIADRVSLPGFSDPWPYYGSADLFVLSSRSEGFGNVLVEAMAAGLPVVSTDCAGPREILESGKWGALVPIGDRDALTRALERFLDKPVDRDGQKSRAREFDPDTAIDAFLTAMLGDSQAEVAA